MTCEVASVLIVEDEAFVAWDLCQTLEGTGKIAVGPAPTVDEGLRIAQSDHLCAAILDINLGKETVWPLADALAERGVPFGFLSANLRHSELEERFGHAPKLSKPVREDDLIAMVDQLIERSSC